MNKFNKGISTPLVAIVIAVSALGGAGATYYYTTELNPQQKSVVCIEEAKVCPDGSTVSRTGSNCEFAMCPNSGTIEGSLSYPSDGIPSTMRVCAEDITTKEEYCTNMRIKDDKYTYGVGYKLEVPVGSYYVFAITGTMKAYYTNPSGLSVANVGIGQNISGIDPVDYWWKIKGNE